MIALPWFSPRKPGWLGVCVFADRVEVAHVQRNGGGKPRVLLAQSCEREGSDADALGRLNRQQGLRGHRCATVLTPGEYQLLQVEAPNVPEEEMRQALRWQLKGLVDFPLDSACVDGFALPGEGNGNARRRQALVVASARETVAARVAAFEKARLTLAAVDVPELAQRNVAALFETENRGLALLVFDAGGGLLTISCKGELLATRRLEIGLAQMAQAPAERRSQLVERIVLELQRTLDNFDRQFNHVALARLLVSPTPDVPELIGELSTNLYVPVQALDLAEALDGRAVSGFSDPLRQASSLTAIGAALRPEAA